MSTGGKANCLCLRGIWGSPKRRYREETKPVVKLPGTTFIPWSRFMRLTACDWGLRDEEIRPRSRARRLTRKGEFRKVPRPDLSGSSYAPASAFCFSIDKPLRIAPLT